MNHKIIFCSIIQPGQKAETNSLLLAESIRAFGKEFSNKPIWFFMPDTGKSLTKLAQARLEHLDVRIVPFNIEIEKLRFFFMAQLRGLAYIEQMCEGEAELVAWMDSNTILVNAPKEFLLPADKIMGYRPVHHLLIGSRYDQPLDGYWNQIYDVCEVPKERIFPMKPVVENLLMRPYFNAGLLVTRPERGLLRKWDQIFLEHYQAPVFRSFYQQDERYLIFMHQAILAGVVLRECELRDLLELPGTYNYPVHLLEQDETDHRPANLDGLITFRHEGFYEKADWIQTMPASDHLTKWLEDKVTDIE